MLTELDRKIDNQLGLERDIIDLPSLVPVVPLWCSEADLHCVRLLREHHPRDLGVRVSLPRRYPVTTLIERISAMARITGTPISGVHIILDEQYMRAIRAVVTSELATLIRGLMDRLHVASVTLLSGSVPKDRSGSESGAEAVRHESQLYDETVLALAGVPLRYGDYGVAHPIPPHNVGMPRRASPYVHYTLSGRRLYVARKVDRSHGRSEEFAEAFAEVAEELTAHPKFAGQHYSWGDRQFVACRTGGRRTGQAKDWIGWRWRHLITLRTCRAVVTATRAATVDLGLRGDWDAARVHRAEHTSS